MELSNGLVVALIIVFGMVSGMMLMYSLMRQTKRFVVGTLIIDTRNESRDICRFVLDTDLETISEKNEVSVKVKVLSGNDKALESFSDYD